VPSIPQLDEFPYVEQAEDSATCVPDCLDMVCQYWGLDKDWDEVAVEVGYSAINATPFDNVASLSRVRVLAVDHLTSVAEHLARDPPRPVVASLVVDDEDVLGWYEGPCLHCVVVVAVEDAQVGIIDPLSRVMRGTTEAYFCSRSAFERAWDGGWVVLPLDLP
jgi:hypothetical protein